MKVDQQADPNQHDADRGKLGQPNGFHEISSEIAEFFKHLGFEVAEFGFEVFFRDEFVSVFDIRKFHVVRLRV